MRGAGEANEKPLGRMADDSIQRNPHGEVPVAAGAPRGDACNMYRVSVSKGIELMGAAGQSFENQGGSGLEIDGCSDCILSR